MTGVLLLHGQPGSAADWQGVVELLDDDLTPVAIDRPGWGRDRRPSDLRGNCAAAVAALDEREISRAIVVGHSFGGAVATWLALQHPDRVAGLVLAAPAANAASLYDLDRWLAAPILGYVASAAALSGLCAALTAAPLRQRIARGLAIDERHLSVAGRRLLTPAAWRAFVYEQRVLIRELPALEDRLGEIAVRTTIVAGTEDHVVPAASIRQLTRQIPRAELRQLEHAGHLLPLQNADDLAAIITEMARAVVRAG